MHRILPLGLLPAVLLIGWAGPLHALEWKAKTVDLFTAPFQSTIAASFEFRNDGRSPVTVRDVQTNCDCLSATPDKLSYEPGARGAIKAIFTVGDRLGSYERTVTVLTDEPGVGPTKLTVKVFVPELAEVSPRSLDWTAGAAAAGKIVVITPTAPLAIVFDEATATNDAFSVRLVEVKPRRLYHLVVTPRDPARTGNAAIRVHGRESTGHEVVVSAYATVK